MSCGRSKLTWVLTLLAITIAGGSVAWYRYDRYKRFAVHEPGKVYRSSWLEADAVGELVAHYKIRTVLNLCDPGEKRARIDAERAAVEAAGGRVVELVYPANDTWHTQDPVFDETEKLLADPATYPILVHCYHGRERTVKALAIYDIHYRGMTAQESLSVMPVWRGGHPWPIITFAFNYETKERQRLAEARLTESQRK
jgi:hypothetical protein